MAEAGEGAGGAAFARTLSTLKERGSTLLVVGTLYDEGHVAVCDRLLGESGGRRRRLVVRTDGDCGAVPPVDEGAQRVIEGRRPGTGRPGDVAVPADETVGLDPLSDLERAAVDAFGALAGGTGEDGARAPEPGELRLCVDSLRPLLVSHPVDRVGRFVEQLGRRVDRVDGIGHFHLPAGSDDRYVSALQPLVDGVVEVRSRDGEPQQRWRVLDGAADSGWVPL